MAPAEERSAHKRHKPASAASRKAAAAAAGGGGAAGGDPLKEVTGFAKTKKKEQDEVLTDMEVSVCVPTCMGGSQGMKVHAWLYGLAPEGGAH